ncbi:MAG: hypothetical protein K4571_02155 [Deltaproteobacteria bacterium]
MTSKGCRGDCAIRSSEEDQEQPIVFVAASMTDQEKTRLQLTMIKGDDFTT